MPRLPRSLTVLVLAAAAVFAGRQAQRSWGSVVAYAPPYRIGDGDASGGAPVAERVVLVLVDGLRLDASREMPVLNRLRAEGADLDCTAAAPSYSRPGRATLATGAWSEIHGATSNYHDRAIAADNLFRAAARSGRSVLVVGSLWESLFGPDLARATLRKPPVKDERGRYFEQEPGLRAWGLESAALVGSTPSNLAVLDLLVTDYAAHEFGARSEEYRRAALRSDGMLAELVKRLDLTRAAIVVTSDHGHLDEGGHGGPEPEVLSTPLVLAGKGIRRGVRSAARQIDVAPTVAALLGLPPPAASQGRALVDALDLADDQRLAVLDRQWRQRAAFATAYLTSLGAAAGASEEPDRRDPAALLAATAALESRVEAAGEARATSERTARLPILLAVVMLPLLYLAALARGLSPAAKKAVAAAVVAYIVAFQVLVQGRGVRLALSAINHEEDVEPYFLRIGLFALVAFLVALAVGFALALRSASSAAGLADVGLTACAVLAYVLGVAVALVHWRYGLVMEWRRADLGPGFGGFVSMVQLQAVGGAALLVLPLAWIVRRLAVAGGGTPRAVTALLFVGLAATPAHATRPAPGPIFSDVPRVPDPAGWYVVYLHGRILEEQGRQAVSAQHGAYEYDAILRALADRGFAVVSELRPRGTGPEYAKKVVAQVRKLLKAGVPPDHVTVAGFSKGGFLALAAAADLGEHRVNFVVMAACGAPVPAFAPRLEGRILSVYDEADDVASSCRETFAKAPGLASREIVLGVGRGHGTFYTPRNEWLDPLVGWALGR